MKKLSIKPGDSIVVDGWDGDEERLVKQAEGIAAAKARGVHFGAQRKPLPENFNECHRRWRSGEIKMSEAAEACGMAKSSFYDAAIRAEQSDGYAV